MVIIRSFNFFIVSSFLFHVACLSLFNVIIEPSHDVFLPNSNISFLGYFMGEVKPISSEANLLTHQPEEFFSLSEAINSDLVRAPVEPEKNIKPSLLKPVISSEKTIFYDVIPNRPLSYIEKKKVEVDLKRDVFLISGDIKNRPVIYRPAFPELPDWIGVNIEDIVIALDIEVTPQGRVSTATLETSSGYPEIDTLFIRYIRQWLFASLSEFDVETTQVGKIRISLSVF